MIVYNYDPNTKEYTNEGLAQENEKAKGEYLIPAYSTPIKPLKPKEKKAIVWFGNKWQYVEDHRNEIWFNLLTKQKEPITFIGPIPETYVDKDSVIANPPAEPYYIYDKNKDAWVGDANLYKQYIFNSFESFWNIKQNQPFSIGEYSYLPSWRELYTSIWTTLRDSIKTSYNIQDANGKIQKVDKTSMKIIITKMSNVVDEMYNDKHELENYFKSENNFDKLEKKFNEWLNKIYE